MADEKKFCDASLDKFEDEALVSTKQAMHMVANNLDVAPDLRYAAYATYGKVCMELTERGY